MSKVLIGCDSYGFRLKEAIKTHLHRRGLDVQDVGVHSETGDRAYYQVAAEVASRVSRREVERGILVCGTGMGMAIIANKTPGAYAAVCENPAAAKHARSINNANILTLGGTVTSVEKVAEIIDAWLDTEFAAGWDPPIKEFLRSSMGEIRLLEQSAFRPSPEEEGSETDDDG